MTVLQRQHGDCYEEGSGMYSASREESGMTLTGCLSHADTALPPPLPSRYSFLEVPYKQAAIDSGLDLVKHLS